MHLISDVHCFSWQINDEWNFLCLFASIIMLRGGNMWFRPAIFIWLVFAQSFFKFHKHGDIRKLKAWSFRLWKNDFCRLYNELARALQCSITIFFIHPVYIYIFFFVYRTNCGLSRVEPATSDILVHRSTNWAINPVGKSKNLKIGWLNYNNIWLSAPWKPRAYQ